jgi:Reverse transcriptase (RNA-dependent DNA polymerase)
MKRKKLYLKYKIERAILSDVLPYETPITFSNRHFYDFLLTHKVQCSNGSIKWEEDDKALESIIRILFGIGLDAEVESKEEIYLDTTIKFARFKRPKKNNDPKNWTFVSIPFTYNISHKENEHRGLAVCHPRNQLQLIDLYREFKELILYYCSFSPFSIRHPSKLAKFIYHKDKTHYLRLSKENEVMEEFHKEYENLKSFFRYKDYSNVHKFYESYKYHRCEQKYNALLKLDITKCFDSIYTHSLAWALIGKEEVKDSLNVLEGTFADKFDKFMQAANYRETNGIIIGPEFSRIFAELILQHIDKKLSDTLATQHDLLHKTDYEIFRYVDDYFVFYNEDSTKNIIQQELQVLLREFKLSLNSAKAETYEKPIITEISIAKLKLADLLSDNLAYRFDNEKNNQDQSSQEEEEAEGGHQANYKEGSIYVNSNKLITRFKTIIKESRVQYKDLQNYSLSVVERKSSRIIRDFFKLNPDDKQQNEKQIVQAILNILDFSFFIYSVSPRVNTTIKLCRIIKIYSDFLRRNDGNIDHRHLVFKAIYDKTLLALKKNKTSKHTQVETLYLLVVLSELGKNYWLEEETLCSYFGINRSEGASIPLNYFSITVLLFYIRNKKRYNWLRSVIEDEICRKFNRHISFLKKDTELTLLLFDTLACPYLQETTKKTLLAQYGITDTVLQESIIQKIEKRKHWFTKWTNFDLANELDAKKSSEVY